MILEETSMVPAGPFSEELRLFEEHRQEWSRSHPGHFVVIQGDTVAPGFFGTYADALRAGLRIFGVQNDFLVKQVWITEPVYLV
jgi:hypothetical protein